MFVQGILSPEVTSHYKGGVRLLFCYRLVYKSRNIQIICHVVSLFVRWNSHLGAWLQEPVSSFSSVSALTRVLIQGLHFYHVLQLAFSLGFPLCMWVCLCLYLEFSANATLMPLCVNITIFSPVSSPLFLFWCVWFCLEGQLFFMFLPFSILLSARVSSCLFLSVKSISAASCQSLPWHPGDLGLRFLLSLCPGLEELVLSEMNSPSRTQTGDSSSVSSFSYREILREKESSTIPARVRSKEEPTAPASTQILGLSFSPLQPSLTMGPAHIFS